MKTNYSKGTDTERKFVHFAYAVSILAVMAFSQAANAEETKENKKSGVSSFLRQLVQKPVSTKREANGLSPYKCTVSGFGMKGRCYLRAGL